MVEINYSRIELHYEIGNLLPIKKWIDHAVPIVIQETDKDELLIEPARTAGYIDITVGGLKLTLNENALLKALNDRRSNK